MKADLLAIVIIVLVCMFVGEKRGYEAGRDAALVDMVSAVIDAKHDCEHHDLSVCSKSGCASARILCRAAYFP